MTQDSPEAPAGGTRARRVGRSRIVRGGAPKGGSRKMPRPRHTVAKVITATLLALGLLTGCSVVMLYNHWNGNLDRKDLAKSLHNRPDKVDVEGPREPLNILIMGSDSRAGDNNIDGMKGIGERSDTTILVHLSASRKFAYGISIPRDTLVDRPTCYEDDGKTTIAGGADKMWNDAFSVGGPACTMQQLEQLSGIRIDNYVVIDFSGFKDMVNALDGVEVCIPEEIEDPEHHITLKAGTREIHGDEALSYVRVRYTVGDGTDPNRIKRQQAFMASMIGKVLSAGTLARPDRLVSFVNALTGSIQTDFKNVAQMADIAGTFQGIGPDRVKFVTTPWVYSTAQPGRVEWTPAVDRLWSLVVNDRPLTAEFANQSISAADDPQGNASGTASPGTDGTTGSTDGATDTATNKGGNDKGGLSDDARAAAGLCNGGGTSDNPVIR